MNLKEADRLSTLIRLHHIDPGRVYLATADFTTSRLCDHGDTNCDRATCRIVHSGKPADDDFLCARCAVRVIRYWLVVRPDEPVAVLVSW